MKSGRGLPHSRTPSRSMKPTGFAPAFELRQPSPSTILSAEALAKGEVLTAVDGAFSFNAPRPCSTNMLQGSGHPKSPYPNGNLCKRCSVEAAPRLHHRKSPYFRPQAGHYTALRAAFAEISNGVKSSSPAVDSRSTARIYPG